MPQTPAYSAARDLRGRYHLRFCPRPLPHPATKADPGNARIAFVCPTDSMQRVAMETTPCEPPVPGPTAHLGKVSWEDWAVSGRRQRGGRGGEEAPDVHGERVRES